jgi:hypothetical protein
MHRHRELESLLTAQQKTEAAQQKTEYEFQQLMQLTRELGLRKDPSERLKQMLSSINTDPELVEEAVSHAVSKILDSPIILHRTHYEYKTHSGDVDGVVIGKYLDEDIIVFCEAKHNMDSSLTKAKSELFSTLSYWETLIALSEDEISTYQLDYDALCVERNRHRKVYFAFGGAKFSDLTAEKLRIRTPWFRVSSDPNGRFYAEIATQ